MTFASDPQSSIYQLPRRSWITATSMSDSAEDKCPVDHKTREAWLEKSRAAGGAANPHPPTTFTSATTTPPSIPAGESCDSTRIEQSVASANPSTSILSSLSSRSRLGTDRETSTIPRAAAATQPNDGTARPANNEQESGASASGNWIYPSEQMFFNAMRRKNYDPQETDMRSIVPIHNAVNERAWQEIKQWEKGRGSESCGGPKLVSFSGTASALTPRARMNTWMGYSAPFDRHDWVVDRCGRQVHYVIDFYSGKDEGREGKSLNFYLDVRPKLNTWEGWRTRVLRNVGL